MNVRGKMNLHKTTENLEDMAINVKIKLAALWVTLMFFYLYADVLAFYQPGHIEHVISGEVVGIKINQIFLLGSAMLMAIPSIMIFLSLTLKAKVNRWTNIILGIFHACVLVSTMFVPVETEETWIYYIFYMLIEALFIALIVWYAWTWPKKEIRIESNES